MTSTNCVGCSNPECVCDGLTAEFRQQQQELVAGLRCNHSMYNDENVNLIQEPMRSSPDYIREIIRDTRDVHAGAWDLYPRTKKAPEAPPAPMFKTTTPESKKSHAVDAVSKPLSADKQCCERFVDTVLRPLVDTKVFNFEFISINDRIQTHEAVICISFTLLDVISAVGHVAMVNADDSWMSVNRVASQRRFKSWAKANGLVGAKGDPRRMFYYYNGHNDCLSLVAEPETKLEPAPPAPMFKTTTETATAATDQGDSKTNMQTNTSPTTVLRDPARTFRRLVVTPGEPHREVIMPMPDPPEAPPAPMLPTQKAPIAETTVETPTSRAEQSCERFMDMVLRPVFDTKIFNFEFVPIRDRINTNENVIQTSFPILDVMTATGDIPMYIAGKSKMPSVQVGIQRKFNHWASVYKLAGSKGNPRRILYYYEDSDGHLYLFAEPKTKNAPEAPPAPMFKTTAPLPTAETPSWLLDMPSNSKSRWLTRILQKRPADPLTAPSPMFKTTDSGDSKATATTIEAPKCPGEAIIDMLFRPLADKYNVELVHADNLRLTEPGIRYQRHSTYEFYQVACALGVNYNDELAERMRILMREGFHSLVGDFSDAGRRLRVVYNYGGRPPGLQMCLEPFANEMPEAPSAPMPKQTTLDITGSFNPQMLAGSTGPITDNRDIYAKAWAWGPSTEKAPEAPPAPMFKRYSGVAEAPLGPMFSSPQTVTTPVVTTWTDKKETKSTAAAVTQPIPSTVSASNKGDSKTSSSKSACAIIRFTESGYGRPGSDEFAEREFYCRLDVREIVRIPGQNGGRDVYEFKLPQRKFLDIPVIPASIGYFNVLPGEGADNVPEFWSQLLKAQRSWTGGGKEGKDLHMEYTINPTKCPVVMVKEPRYPGMQLIQSPLPRKARLELKSVFNRLPETFEFQIGKPSVDWICWRITAKRLQEPSPVHSNFRTGQMYTHECSKVLAFVRRFETSTEPTAIETTPINKYPLLTRKIERFYGVKWRQDHADESPVRCVQCGKDVTTGFTCSSRCTQVYDDRRIAWIDERTAQYMKALDPVDATKREAEIQNDKDKALAYTLKQDARCNSLD